MSAAVLGVYARALDAPFLFDDYDSIVENSSIRRLWPLFGDKRSPGPLDAIRPSAASGRPLVNLSLAVNYHFDELDPRGYRLLNMAVHVSSALLLAAVIRRTLRLGRRESSLVSAAWPLSVLAALLWVLHPLQTEAVAYVTQRTELFVGFFYLATLYAGLRYWTATSRDGRTAWLVLATLSCSAGAASKEVIVTAPLVVLLFERTFLTGSFRRAVRDSWPLYAGLLLSWPLLLALNAHQPRGPTAGFDLEIAPQEWWLTQAKVLWTYLKLVVWPAPLVIHYGRPGVDTLAEAWPWLLATACLAIGTVWLLARRSPFGFLAAAAWLVLSPTLVVPIATEVAAERRMYLSLAAIITMLVVGAYAWLRRSISSDAPRARITRRTMAALAGAGVTAILLSGLVSARRLSVYQSELSIWQDAVAKQPDDAVAHLGLGNALSKAGRWQEAAARFERAVELQHDFGDAYNNWAGALLKLGRREQALAILERYTEAAPKAVGAHLNYGILLLDAGRIEEALERFDAVLRLKPNHAAALHARGTALLRLARTPEAIESFERSLALEPDRPQVCNDLGLALLRAGQPDRAIGCFERALQLDPGSADAHYNLGRALLVSDRQDQASEHFEQALLLARSSGNASLARHLETKLHRGSGSAAPVSYQGPPPFRRPFRRQDVELCEGFDRRSPRF